MFCMTIDEVKKKWKRDYDWLEKHKQVFLTKEKSQELYNDLREAGFRYKIIVAFSHKFPTMLVDLNMYTDVGTLEKLMEDMLI